MEKTLQERIELLEKQMEVMKELVTITSSTTRQLVDKFTLAALSVDQMADKTLCYDKINDLTREALKINSDNIISLDEQFEDFKKTVTEQLKGLK
jgi:hypothetical protein